MNYIIYFDYAAVMLGMVLLIFYTPKMSIPSNSNRIYKFILFAEVVASGLDIITVFQYKHVELFSDVYLYLANILYLVVWNAMPMVLTMYTRSFLSVKIKNAGRTWLLSGIPFYILALVIISTPFTKLIFYFDADRVYTHGPLHVVTYIVSALYMLATVAIAIRFRKDIGRKRLMAICAFVLIVLAAIVIQVFNSDLLILHFFAACAALVMYMALQSPEDSQDRETGLYNREAFITVVSDKVRHDAPFTIVSVVPDNIKSLSTILGIESFHTFMKTLGDYIHRTFATIPYIVEDETIAFFADDEAMALECAKLLKKRFEMPWNIGGVSFNRTVSISIVSYPQVSNDTEGLMDAVNYSLNELKKTSNGSLMNVTEPPHGGLNLDELEKQKLLLEEESREANLAKERAEKSDREKSMFLANMSHEIRTPMNAIIGMTELILRDDINERVRQNVNDIKGAGDALLSIINNILDISKVESGKMEIACEEYDVRKMIGDIVTLISTRIDMPRVAFNIDVDKNIPEKLAGDEVRVRQVFINLLNNAAKFTSAGSVGLKVGGSVIDGKFVLHGEVSDTGCGIKEEDKDKLFESFARIENSRNRYVEGTGLGLPLCKKLLTLMDSDIKVESEYGKGSKFTVDIPQGLVGSRTIGEAAEAKKTEILIIAESAEKAEAGEIMQLREALESLGADYSVCGSTADVEAAMVGKKITHVFTYRSLYENYVDWLHDYSNPEIILFSEKDMRYDDIPDAVILANPIYSLGVLRLLEADSHTKKVVRESFKIHDAEILVVDDNRVNLKVFEGLLKCFGIGADSVQSGKEAIEKTSEKQYHIIFMDHMMPEMDGIETTHRIRNMGGHNGTVPIVALTANAVYGIRNMFIQEGFTEYLSKPVDMKHLSACLRKFIPEELILTTDGKPVTNEGEKAGPEMPLPEENTNGGNGLPKLTNVNAALGISNYGGNIDRYKETLDTFYKNGLVQRAQMARLYESGNYRNLKVEVHTLKVMSNSIGATELGNIAKGLEEALANADINDVSSKYITLKEWFDRIIIELEGYFAQEQAAGEAYSKPVTTDYLAGELGRIGDALSEYDDELAGRVVNELLKYRLDENVSSKVLQLKELIDAFDYENASKAVEQLIVAIKK